MEEEHIQYTHNPQLSQFVIPLIQTPEELFMEHHATLQQSIFEYLETNKRKLSACVTLYKNVQGQKGAVFGLTEESCKQIRNYNKFMLKCCKSVLKHAKKNLTTEDYNKIKLETDTIDNLVKSLPDFLQVEKNKFRLKR